MNVNQINAYVQAFLHTNDPDTISNIPNFVSNAASRVAAVYRGVIIEKMISVPPAAELTLPSDFLQARTIVADAQPLAWVSPARMAEIQQQGSQDIVTSTTPVFFTIAAGLMTIYPAPSVGIVIDYLGINQDSPQDLAAQLPAMLIQGAVAEGMKFEGDNEGGEQALQDFMMQLESARGWEINGTITLGGK